MTIVTHRMAAIGLTILVIGCAATVPLATPTADAQAKSSAPDPGSAKLYVIRQSQYYGKAILFHVSVDGQGQAAGGLASGTYRVFAILPGDHEIRVFSNENESVKRITASAGSEYFVRIHAKTGFVTGRVDFDADVPQTRDALAGLKLAQ
jgi:hypothetical protein